MRRFTIVVAPFLAGLVVTAAFSGCTACAHKQPGAKPRIPWHQFSLRVATQSRILRAIRHRARIYTVRVLRCEPLPSVVEWSNLGYLVVRVEQAIYGPASHRLRIYYGNRTMSIAMPARPFWDPQSRALKRGSELLVILYPAAYEPHSSVLGRVASTQIWVLWGRSDPLVESVDDLVSLTRLRTTAGGRHKNNVIDSAIRTAETQADVWERCHSNRAGITSAEDALNKVAAAFGRHPLGQAAMVIGVRAAPGLIPLRGTKPVARRRLVAALVAATLAAPPIERVPLVRCLGKIVVWGDAPAAISCMNVRRRRRLDMLLSDMIGQATARPELTRFLLRDLAWLWRDVKG